MTSLVLATRLIRPFTLMFSRSLGYKNIGPKVLYLWMPVPDSDIQHVHYILVHPRTIGIPAAL